MVCVSETTINTKLDAYGLRPYSLDEIREKAAAFRTALQTGMQRNGPFIPDRGDLAAIKTGVQPLTQEQWDKVPEGTQMIGCAFAGTNWITNRVTKVNGQPVVDEKLETKKVIPQNERQMTFDEFIALMADQVAQQYVKSPNAQGIAVSFGFAQKNIINPDGTIDAVLLSANPSKFWEIRDWEQHKDDLLGKALVEKLHERGITTLDRFGFQNDINAVAHHTRLSEKQKLPVGFVAGTGDNAALHDINLEAGAAVVDKKDRIHYEMEDQQLIPKRENGDRPNIIEYIMGGFYVKARAIAALGLLKEDRLVNVFSASLIMQRLKRDTDGALISKIASGEISLNELRNKLDAKHSLSPQEYVILQDICKRTLQQAGQMIGIMIGETIRAAGYDGKDKATYNMEGSVFWKGFGIQETVKETLDVLFPEQQLEAVNACGLIGIAQLGMARLAERQK